MISKIAAFTALILFQNVGFASSIDIPETLWNTLSDSEKEKITQLYEANLLAPDTYGFLIDVQTQNKSTSGNNVGSSLGAAYGEANYIDRAFSGNNIDYSASKQITAGLAGAILGSLLLDKAPVSKYSNRYTVKTITNEIKYIEETSSSAQFTQSVGLCVLLNPIRPASQDLCTLTKAELLLKLDSGTNRPSQQPQSIPLETKSVNSNSINKKVKCKIGNNAPTYIDSNLCIQVNGEIQ